MQVTEAAMAVTHRRVSLQTDNHRMIRTGKTSKTVLTTSPRKIARTGLTISLLSAISNEPPTLSRHNASRTDLMINPHNRNNRTGLMISQASNLRRLINLQPLRISSANRGISRKDLRRNLKVSHQRMINLRGQTRKTTISLLSLSSLPATEQTISQLNQMISPPQQAGISKNSLKTVMNAKGW